MVMANAMRKKICGVKLNTSIHAEFFGNYLVLTVF